MLRRGATAAEHRVAQTMLSAACGFSSPNWPSAADLPEKEEICTILFSREDPHCCTRCDIG